MQYLLDTQIIVWALNEPEKLSSKVKNILENENHILHISAFSLFEIKLKSLKNKLVYPPQTAEILKEMDIAVLPITTRLIENLKIYSPKNKDPFDNIIIATAIENNYALVTSDSAILELELKHLKVIDARK